MLNDLFKRTEYLVQQSVECKLKQMLKPFKRALMSNRMRMKVRTINWICQIYYPKVYEKTLGHSTYPVEHPKKAQIQNLYLSV